MGRDSNPRYLAVHTLSRRAQSTALAPILETDPDFGTSPQSFQPKSIMLFLRANQVSPSPLPLPLPRSRPRVPIALQFKKPIMPNETLKHATLVFERTCAAAVPRVFAALADPVERAGWGTPSENAVLVYDQADFRVGGHDIFRCGSKQNPEYRGVTTYYDIVPNQRIISSETIEVGGAKLLISLSTTVLEPANTGTKLSVTVQAVSLVGDDMIDGTETGYNASLDNLVEAMR